MVTLSLLLACAAVEPAPSSAPTPLSDAALLARASLDLRGVRPSLDELDQLEADPGALDGLIDGFLQDSRFEARVRDLFSEVYLTRWELYDLSASDYGLDDDLNPSFIASVGEEPLRVLGYIAAHDLPYTELVTGDWTMADDLLAAAWPVDYPAGESGWRRVSYTDGRPAAGVLASSALWLRYNSTDSNANRKRANTTSRVLLCEDYLTRPINFDRNVNLLDEEAVNDALHSNPACVNCHSSLDPLAAYFWGFWTYYGTPSEVVTYHPEREMLWQDATGVPPAYYGDPSSSLGQLGQQIAADPRFPNCAVEQVTRLLLRRDLTVADTDALTRHREAFLQGGLTLRPLFRSVLHSAAWRSSDPADDSAVSAKLVTPELLATQIQDLTGYAWTWLGYDLMRSDLVGLRTMAGGADGVTVTATARRPSSTLVLVAERLAESAASYAIAQEAALPQAERALFTEVDLDQPADAQPEAAVAQIQRLHRRIFTHSVAPDGPEVQANLELYAALYAVDGDPRLAWQGLFTALLRDPDLLVY